MQRVYRLPSGAVPGRSVHFDGGHALHGVRGWHLLVDKRRHILHVMHGWEHVFPGRRYVLRKLRHVFAESVSLPSMHRFIEHCMFEYPRDPRIGPN